MSSFFLDKPENPIEKNIVYCEKSNGIAVTFFTQTLDGIVAVRYDIRST